MKLKSLFENHQLYFYHATTADALPGIISRGLLPSGGDTHWGGDLGKFSEGKVFVTSKFDNAVNYGNAGIWKSQHHNRFKPLLRLRYSEKELDRDTQSIGDYYSEIPIRASFEIFVGDENTDDRGDIHPKNGSGVWRSLTSQLADAIYHGEWDGEIIDDEDEEV